MGGKDPATDSKRLNASRHPLGDVLRQAVEGDGERFTDALRILQALHRAGREEAGISLLGLLAYSGDDWKRRTEIAEKLRGFNTEGCLSFIVGELRRVKSSNTTRPYIAAILKVLEEMPLEFAQPTLLELMSDSRFSTSMHNRFAQVLYRKSDR